MRLLFVHDRFGAMAGAEVNLFLTATELKSRGHQVAILHGSSTGKGEASWAELFPDRFGIEMESPANSVVNAIRGFQPEAIYVHKMSDAAVLRALVESRVPVVRMVHDHDLYCLRSYKYFPLTRKVCSRGMSLFCIFPCGGVLTRQRNASLPFRWKSYLDKLNELNLNKRFQRMIVATGFMRQELVRNGFSEGAIEIHPPVPRDGEAAQTSFSDRNLIVYSGQVIRGKGVDVLLEALAKIDARFECVILGDGHHRGFCERLSRNLGLGDRVRFAGYLPPDELQAFYSQATVAVVSSVWPEPFGAVGLEAMRHGVPVVGFDAGGIREWLVDGQNGFLVPWMDRVQFAARIEQLLRDKALARRLGAEGRRMAREQFGFDHYISGLEQMFNRVCGERVCQRAGERVSERAGERVSEFRFQKQQSK